MPSRGIHRHESRRDAERQRKENCCVIQVHAPKDDALRSRQQWLAVDAPGSWWRVLHNTAATSPSAERRSPPSGRAPLPLPRVCWITVATSSCPGWWTATCTPPRPSAGPASTVRPAAPRQAGSRPASTWRFMAPYESTAGCRHDDLQRPPVARDVAGAGPAIGGAGDARLQHTHNPAQLPKPLRRSQITRLSASY